MRALWPNAAPAGSSGPGAKSGRFIGIDAGAESIKLVELLLTGEGFRLGRREILDHGKKPGAVLVQALQRWDFSSAQGAAVTGRFANQFRLAQIPAKQAQLRGYRALYGDQPATLVNIGSHGFSVLEVREDGLTVFRENGRCSQGTGNFLRQLVERFSLTVEEASALCADVSNPAPLSGRCPVILKTDMTHLANKGEDRARILAGLFDAVCENVQVLIKPGVSPRRVLLLGGVSRSRRVRRVFSEMLSAQGMEVATLEEEESLCLEALGCAHIAAETPGRLPAAEDLLVPAADFKAERIPALQASLARVRRMPARPWANGAALRRTILGLDIGSTGSKLVAIDAQSRETLWEGYRQTLGNPVGAAQDLVGRFLAANGARLSVIAFGATGSGREVAGSLLTSCYGKEAVYITNEIVAHATGALHYDSRVDTIFEIGGQDAKYIRLAEGRIIDCAMNEACSAGTGSFIEEQGGKFSGIRDVTQLGQAAVSAPAGVSLGQHCSVFMAEVIDEAVAAGISQPEIISGLYDSIIKNYLNRVKGNRSVGKVIFCQGMPFSADALAAAVARQTGSEVIVPPNPGTVGALGIGLLAVRELDVTRLAELDLQRFLGAKVEQKDTFICGANTGCGGAGNHCRIERLRTVVGEQRSAFTWGGNCALYDKGTRKRKLPNLAPDPFREREERLERLCEPLRARREKPRIAIADEFMLKGLFPFFAVFLHEAGFDLEIVSGADRAALKRGIQSASVPFCAPMQLFHGLAQQMIATGADWIFLPLIRSMPPAEGQQSSVVCPIAQAVPDVLNCLMQGRQSESPGQSGRADPGGKDPAVSGLPRLLAPKVNFGVEGLDSPEFKASCRELGELLGLPAGEWSAAWVRAAQAQRQFEAECLAAGQKALEFCRAHEVVPVVVLGRNYTIYNTVLNSNVPAILREQGAIAIPLDCYAVGKDVPVFQEMFWAYGQHILRAAHQVRRSPGVYALYCSNYACGPDSFNLHFAAYSVEGKPFAVIETDGHSGDAGTRTRVEAFLHCVNEDRQAQHRGGPANDFAAVQHDGMLWKISPRRSRPEEQLLIPYLGPGSETVGAIFRGMGLPTETLPPPDTEALRLGRRHTSGKECLPMPLTLGSLLKRLERASPNECFVYVLPSANGPCRFGAYKLLTQIALDRLGWQDRVRIWSPKDNDYFAGVPAGSEILVLAAFLAGDMLLQAQLDVRPVEKVPGSSNRLYRSLQAELLALCEEAARRGLGLGRALWQVARGDLFGLAGFLSRAGAAFAALRGPNEVPTVELTGEIYVRVVGFSNDSLIEKLEARGLRVRLARQAEWLAYCSFTKHRHPGRNRLADGFSERVEHRVEHLAHRAIAPAMGWPAPPSVPQVLDIAEPYLSCWVEGEAGITLGGALHAWRGRQIAGVVNVGPLECMPTKIAEAQFHHLAEREGLLSLTLAFNGDPISPAALDNFAYEVKSRFGRDQGAAAAPGDRKAEEEAVAVS